RSSRARPQKATERTSGRASSVHVHRTVADARPLVLSVAFWGLALLLLFTPFFRGLFFATEQYRALIFAAAVFWMTAFGRWLTRENRFFAHPLDYLMLALPLVYLYSAFFAVNTGLAVNEIVKNTLYFLAFWVAARLVTTVREAETLLKVVYLAAIGVALAGLATATGIIDIKDGFNPANGQISSSFQYHATLGAYLGAVFLLGSYLWLRAVDEPQRLDKVLPFGLPAWLGALNPRPYLYALGNTLIMTVFLGAQANGAFLVFAVLYPLFLLGLAKGRRIPALWHLALTGAPALGAIALFLRAVAAKNYDLAWLWVLLGLVLAKLLQLAMDWYVMYVAPRLAGHRNAIVGGTVALAVLAAGGALAWAAGNTAVIERLLTALRWHNFLHRLNYIADALEMVAARPLTGWGGGGWQEAYRAFLDYNFVTRQVHGHYAQVSVETGVLGLLLYVALWGVFLWTAHRLYHGAKDDPARRALVWAVTMVAVALGAHAVFDFDLSLSAVALVLFTLFGMLAGLAGGGDEESSAETARRQRRKSSYVPPDGTRLAAFSAAAVLIVVFGLTLALSAGFTAQAAAKLQSGDVNGGIAALKRAAAYNPSDPDPHDLLAQAYRARGDLKSARAEAERAASLSQYDPRRYQLLASIAAAQDQPAQAEKYAEKAVDLAPLDVRQYEALAQTHVTLALNAVDKGKKDEARAWTDKALAVPQRMQERMKAVSEEDLRLWSGPRLQPRPDLRLSLGVARCLRGEYQPAVAELDPARKNLQDRNAKGQATLWLVLAKEKQGKAKEAGALLKEAEKLNPRFKDLYDTLKALPLPV
ncbi:MAG: O-antigen ligase family protein, partial [Bacillota bacterium]|nr:O-antigen ligase family protein [Bacillota bacterium]